MGLADQARKILAWRPTKAALAAITPPPVVADDGVPLADGATVTGPIVWIRAEDGTLTPCHAPSAKDYKFWVNGVSHEHVDTLPDGTWVYVARA